ncbi:MAG: hypothetical protein U0836_18235 [Pirellulales bacterium]
MALNNQANRLLRKQWGNGIDPFAEELFSLIQSDTDLTSGPVAFNLNSDLAVAGQELMFSSGPLDDLGLAAIDYDAIDALTAQPTPDSQATVDSSGNSTAVTTTTRVRRTVLPGKVVSREQDGTYTIDLYPRGFDGQASRYRGCVEAAGRDVALNAILGAVLRIDDVRVREFVVSRPDGSELSRRTEVDLLSRNHLFAEGNNPRAYAPWGSGANLDQSPAQAHVLSFINEIVQDGIDGSQNASSLFVKTTPLLWLPDYRTRTYTNLQRAFIGSTAISLGSLTLTYDPAARTLRTTYNGGTPAGFSAVQDALTWAQSSGNSVTPGGVGILSYPANAWNTGAIYFTTGGGWNILQGAVTTQWANLGGSPAIYSRCMLAFS